jgi:site-specific DNA recombinase
MTGAWSKGKTKYYAYYRCETRGCEAKGKSVPRAKMEDGFAEIMKGMEPTKGLFELAKAMMRDAWDMRLASAQSDKEALKKQLGDVERQIENLLDRLVETDKASVVAACEARIDRLEREKLVLSERLEKTAPPKGRLEECIELALGFLASPWNIYKNGDHAMRQLVLRLAFSRPLLYCQNGVYGTPEFSFPFRYLGEISGSKSEMVRVEGLEPPRLAAPEPKSGASTNFATPACAALCSRGFPGRIEAKRMAR